MLNDLIGLFSGDARAEHVNEIAENGGGTIALPQLSDRQDHLSVDRLSL